MRSRGHSGEGKDARADNGSNPQRYQRKSAEASLQPLVAFRFGYQRFNGFRRK